MIYLLDVNAVLALHYLKHTTDGHLLNVADAHRAVLATLDTGIPGSELIVDAPASPWAVREPSAHCPTAA